TLPKVMHILLGQPMIHHVLKQLDHLKIDKTIVVVGYQAQTIQDYLKESVAYAFQLEQKGTGHAVMQAVDQLESSGDTIILVGDCPLIQTETLKQLFIANEQYDLSVLSANLDNPASYGRIIREGDKFKKIVEFRDCSEQEKLVHEINTGIYCVKNAVLKKYIHEIKDNNQQKEFYLTDLVEILYQKHYKVQAIIVKDNNEVMGINDRIELNMAQNWLQDKVNTYWMSRGVTMIDPKTTYISVDTLIEKDVIIYPNVIIQGECTISCSTQIFPNCFIENSSIGQGCTIDSSRITDSILHDRIKVGPNAHIRNHSIIQDEVRLGNFVEVKNSTIGKNTKCAHLTYIGDAEIGEKVNIGCGVVTVNYDGKHKYKTIIKDYAFIGSNVNLIAPITIGSYALIAAGSTVTNDVPDGDMAIARQRQENKPGLGLKYIKKG
ncbi:MAG: bifunctional UDP-N-acetylglucosamine diphosphorylase/glucosamine-1-phosphate N-acetyltransferase GlmU, partial [Erysipelotrichaceae bacterium]